MIDPRVVIKLCPKCNREVQMSHDKFEDMYRCDGCSHFWYPEELNTDPDPDAGFMKLSSPIAHLVNRAKHRKENA